MAERPSDDVVIEWNKEIIANFSANNGQVIGVEGFDGGDRILLLTTTGAKSGQLRTSPMSYAALEGKLQIVGSNAGVGRDPNWVFNLRANPDARIEIDTTACDVVARELHADERERIWQQLVEREPRWAQYQADTDKLIPVFELTKTSKPS